MLRRLTASLARLLWDAAWMVDQAEIDDLIHEYATDQGWLAEYPLR